MTIVGYLFFEEWKTDAIGYDVDGDRACFGTSAMPAKMVPESTVDVAVLFRRGDGHLRATQLDGQLERIRFAIASRSTNAQGSRRGDGLQGRTAKDSFPFGLVEECIRYRPVDEAGGVKLRLEWNESAVKSFPIDFYGRKLQIDAQIAQANRLPR